MICVIGRALLMRSPLLENIFSCLFDHGLNKILYFINCAVVINKISYKYLLGYMKVNTAGNELENEPGYKRKY